MVPSERVIVPSSDWLTPPPACGVPLTVTGGHAAAHAPVHVDVPPLSASNRYIVRPWPSTRALPGIPEMAAWLIVVAAALLDDPVAAGLLACEADDDAGAAAVLLLLEPLEQAVAARTIPAAHAAPTIQFFMVILPRDTVRGVHGRPPGCLTVPTGEYGSRPGSVHRGGRTPECGRLRGVPLYLFFYGSGFWSVAGSCGRRMVGRRADPRDLVRLWRGIGARSSWRRVVQQPTASPAGPARGGGRGEPHQLCRRDDKRAGPRRLDVDDDGNLPVPAEADRGSQRGFSHGHVRHEHADEGDRHQRRRVLQPERAARFSRSGPRGRQAMDQGRPEQPERIRDGWFRPAGPGHPKRRFHRPGSFVRGGGERARGRDAGDRRSAHHRIRRLVPRGRGAQGAACQPPQGPGRGTAGARHRPGVLPRMDRR